MTVRVAISQGPVIMKWRTFITLLAVASLTSCLDDLGTNTQDSLNPSVDDELGEEYEPYQAGRGKANGLQGVGEALKFSEACESGETLTIAAVGDVLLHSRLQKQAFRENTSFTSLWWGVSDLLKTADVTYANLEGPTAKGTDARGRDVMDPGPIFDDYVYTSYPMFNYHPSLLDSLQEAGVDVVSTANNHSLDRRSLGVDRTISELQSRSLQFTGTRKKGADDPWFAITDTNGFRLAWLACTYSTNSIPDNHDQVLRCYEHRDEVLAEVRALSAREDIDVVVVTPHWGVEYRATPNKKEIDLAHELLEAGAMLVLGGHPHVNQPWEKYTTTDGREGFVIYSLGNFVSGQRHLARRSTILLYVSLVRNDLGETNVAGATYVPLHMTNYGDGSMSVEAIDRAGGNGDSREFTVGMFGLWNLSLPRIPVETTAYCEGGWEPAHPLDGWVGGSCTAEVNVCGTAACAEDFPGGMCTIPCERVCPDKAGRAGTFCVAGPTVDTEICVPKCESDDGCRPGYTCAQQERNGEPGVNAMVCVAR